MKSAPISKQERIVTLDIIRGFALLGIFLVNMPTFHSPALMISHPDYTGMDYWLDLFLQMFVQTKFYTIFSFLFGLGFYIFMSRAEQKDLHVNRLFSRRLFALLLFGAIHLIFIWYGDILHTYAIAGFLLLLFYKRKPKTLLIWAFSLLFVFYSLASVPLFIPESTLEEIAATTNADTESKVEEYVDMYENGNYLEWVSYRFQTEVIPILLKTPLIMITILAMFLFGLYAGKIGIFKSNTPYQTMIKKIRLISFLLSIPLVSLLAIFKLDLIDLGIYREIAIQLVTNLSGLTLCFFYMSSITLLLRKKTWQKLLRPLGYTGQMALTNYISQTLISVFIFLGLNYFGKVSLVTGTIICLTVYVFQVVFSYVWLRHYKYGPLEWLWRSLTYGYFQPMKREDKEKQMTNHITY
jgi:uncharacterized protein